MAPSPQESTLPLSVELLEDIFLRLASPVDLASASATCKSFRQAIAEPDFPRRYRAAHPAVFLGFVLEGFCPVAAPHPNAAAARAVAARAEGFDFNYLPGGGGWEYSDVCEGRVLLERSRGCREDGCVSFPDLVVCDPLSRRYLLLPTIPDALITSVQAQNHYSCLFESFLVPSGHHEGTSFKVMARTHCAKKLVVFIFSSESSNWSVGISTRWVDIGLTVPPFALILSWPQYDHGCFYWKVDLKDKMLKLDITRMEFSILDLPPLHTVRDVIIVEVRADRLAMFSHYRNEEAVAYYTSVKNEVGSANEWRRDNDITLPCQCRFVAASGGYIFLIGFEYVGGILNTVYFSLEVETLKIERLCSPQLIYIHVHPYFGFPPFMSPRRI